jgi:hypothetical protein
MQELELEDPGRFIELGRFDWYMSKSWNRLHYVHPAAFGIEHRDDIAHEWGVSRPVTLACGRTATALHIPGFFSRLSAPRCTGCCRATGIPEGPGSPKNSDECRAVLGLEDVVASSR